VSQYVAVCCVAERCVAVCHSCIAVCRSTLQCVVLQSVVLQCVTAVLQCVAVRCSVLCCRASCCSASQLYCSASQYVAVSCIAERRVAVCRGVLQYVAVCCSVLCFRASCCSVSQLYCSALQYVALCCIAERCIVVCRSVLQCVAVSFCLSGFRHTLVPSAWTSVSAFSTDFDTALTFFAGVFPLETFVAMMSRWIFSKNQLYIRFVCLVTVYSKLSGDFFVRFVAFLAMLRGAVAAPFDTATHRNALQHAATRCNRLQHTLPFWPCCAELLRHQSRQ